MPTNDAAERVAKLAKKTWAVLAKDADDQEPGVLDVAAVIRTQLAKEADAITDALCAGFGPIDEFCGDVTPELLAAVRETVRERLCGKMA